MNKIFLQLWLMTLGSLILHSCTQNEAIPDVEYQDQENEITFRANEGTSRAFLGSNLSTANTTMCIYGYKGNTPLAQGKDKELVGKTLKYNGQSWAVVDNTGNPITYFWEGAGDYKFFGYLTKDGANTLSNPFTTSYLEQKLTISKTIDSNDQFDYLYSELDLRTMDANNNSNKGRTVSMNMKHLLTAFSIGAENTTDEQVTIKKVEIRGLHNEGTAVIDYSGDAVSLNLTTSINNYTPDTEAEKTQNNKPVFVEYQNNEGFVLPSKRKLVNLLSPNLEAENYDYYMIWPQAASAVAPTNRIEGDPTRRFAAADSLIYIEYTMDGKTHERRMKFPSNLSWEAGKKYHFDVLFSDQLVQLNSTVKDWTYTSATVDFANNSVLVHDHQTINNGWNQEVSTVNHTAKTVTVKNHQPIEATFAISAPTGARWRVSMEGDIDAFEISDDEYPYDDKGGSVGVESHITLTPTIPSPDKDYKVKLKFVIITADSKTIAIDSWLQDSDGNPSTSDIYQLILPVN